MEKGEWRIGNSHGLFTPTPFSGTLQHSVVFGLPYVGGTGYEGNFTSGGKYDT